MYLNTRSRTSVSGHNLMMASIPQYNRYAQEVLMPQIDPAVLAEIKALEATVAPGSRSS